MKSILTILLLTTLGVSYGQSYKVIVNKSNGITSISKSDLSDLFMKKETKFSSGERVVPVDQKGNSSVRKSFSSDVLNKSVAAIKSYWQQSVFQGKATPPVEKSSDQEVIAYVANNPGAIGYVSSGANTSSVKGVSVN